MSLFKHYYCVSDEEGKNKFDTSFMERFPILFNKSGSSCCRHISCPKGWYFILEQLCTFLEFYNIEFSHKYHLAIVADQVKEKFGTLRFYYSIREVDDVGMVNNDIKTSTCLLSDSQREIVEGFLSAKADEVINDAEHLTSTTCASCGCALTNENIDSNNGGWIGYKCNDCAEKRKCEY